MGTLRQLATERTGEGHQGEIYSCAYAPDGAFVLTGGWDGHLRLWDAGTGNSLVALRAGLKPLSCCAFMPDGKQWLSGSMEGMLAFWDAVSHESYQTFVAHTRPISAICYSPDGQLLVTSSWDRQIALRKVGKEREGKVLHGHRDIVAGCRFTQDGTQLLSWSHDGTLCVWDPNTGGTLVQTLTGHEDRITAAAVSPDGRLAASGGRDGMVKLWNLQQGQEIASVVQVAEITGCFFLLDGRSLVTVDAYGWLVLLSLPSLDLQCELQTAQKVLCGDLSPVGNQIALGCEDGFVSLVAIEGFEDAPLLVTATKATRIASSMLGRFFGRNRVVSTYHYTCPACHQLTETDYLVAKDFPCPHCKRILRLSDRVAKLEAEPTRVLAR